jgi:hypothetical protein
MLFIRALAAIVLAAFSLETWAAPSVSGASPIGLEDEIQIPKTTTAPPSMLQHAPVDPFHCERNFVYQGKILDCDSNVARDGERLRPIFRDTPGALTELNAYQRNRRNLRIAAYTTSLGFVMFLAGFVISQPPFQNFGFPLSQMSINTGGYFVLSGLGLSVGSFAYALSLSRTNEQHLRESVDQFNQAHPNQPIELQFKTGFTF